ncbi:LruC domain-containing protein [Teredinibacter purpureus]|uniref:LruC domain-containing protein n=1 Tax=Teredinibacter purpureus TaxID=2731756 RepID=UPI0005F7B623|nr:LruC domain-containing protein [Teredinibacter purpureus]
MSKFIKRAAAGFILGAISFASNGLNAAPFSDCPNEAFLVQNKVSTLFGVRLATGFYEQISPLDWNQSKMNALAFSVHDNFLYAYSYSHGSIVRIHSDFDVEPVWLSNMPDKGFYVGDISVAENAYYLFRPGANYGLYRVSLDENSADYLDLVRVVDGSALNLAIYDLAFHPSNGFAYAVDRWGNLWKIDVSAGTSEQLSNVGEAGVFGAVYFDVDGNLYLSRNKDGHIFRINTNWDYPIAEFYAHGPSSSNNDGARCALAPIVSAAAPTTDFGDAPDSYGTSINANGARHEISEEGLFLGQQVTAEPNAYASNGSGIDDNDGVNFVTGSEAGQSAIVEVESSATGYLNAWVDWDRDGEFDSDEQTITAKAVNAGQNIVVYGVPTWAEPGSTWSRFRISSQQNVGPTGGVSDGEVEDYKIDVAEQNVTVARYPAANAWATLAFEDNWPLMGDYDMNDLVVHYRLSSFTSEDTLLRIKIEGEIVAIGASFHNGFAFRIPGLLRSEIDQSRAEFIINNQRRELLLETNQDDAIFIIANDLWDFVTPGENCKFYRTEPECGSNIQMTFSLEIPVVANVAAQNIASFPYDPFIFGTEGHERSYVFGEAPGRRYEIHLKNQAPTAAFQDNFLGRGDDASNAAFGEYFVNENGMPWAINIPYEWQYPIEYMDVKYAYPDFHGHVSSAGANNVDWFTVEKSNPNNTFTQ